MVAAPERTDYSDQTCASNARHCFKSLVQRGAYLRYEWNGVVQVESAGGPYRRRDGEVGGCA